MNFPPKPPKTGLEGITERKSIPPEEWQNLLRHVREHKRGLIQLAFFARKHAKSHRNFLVGCSVLGIDPGKPLGEYDHFEGWNETPFPAERKGADKRCAERNALEKAKDRVSVVGAIATLASESSTDGVSSEHDALHPCLECRRMLRQFMQEGFLRPDTLIFSANDENPINVISEERTLEELLKLYPND